MRWKVGGRPRKSWMSCAVFWTSTRGEADDQLRELDFARGSAHARLDVVAFHLAGRRAGGSVCRGDRGLPKLYGALRAGGERARFDDGLAGHHLHVVARASESVRAEWCWRSFALCGNVHPKRHRPVKLPRPCRRISNRAAKRHAVAGGSVVPGCPFAEPENRGGIVSDREDAAQRGPAGRWRAVRKMSGAAARNGPRPCHQVLRVPWAGRSSGTRMVPSRRAAAGEGADRLERAANRSEERRVGRGWKAR